MVLSLAARADLSGRDVHGWLCCGERESRIALGHSSYAFEVQPDVLAALRAMGARLFH
jgi:hypothetical protein